jgi:cytochrome c oxidase subunit 2
LVGKLNATRSHFLDRIKRHKKRPFALLTASLLILVLSGCSNTAPSILNAKSPAADEILGLTWLLFILGGIVYLAVMAYLLIALFRRRRTEVINQRKERVGITLGGVIVTVIILLVVFGVSVRVLGSVSALNEPSQVSVRIYAQQWWWQVEYPGLDIVTANEVHIPVGQPVLLDLRSPDVIHSFWVPQLHGKRDVIPGQVNTFWITADEPGIYWGECAEFCGVQHAQMRFVVVAESPEEYEAWVARQQQAAQLPENPYYQRGLEVFMQSGCAGCHTIAGTDAQGQQGPDLTHLASRHTLAAGALTNTKANLGGWVADPQGIKPGNKMPNLAIPGEDLRALIDFLTILE